SATSLTLLAPLPSPRWGRETERCVPRPPDPSSFPLPRPHATLAHSSRRLPMSNIAVAGPSGRLGHLIVRALLDRGAGVTALVRPGTPAEKRAPLAGAAIAEIDYADPAALQRAFAGTEIVVSALNGLRDIVVDAQTALL